MSRPAPTCLPPLAITHRPARRLLPENTCDCHFHVFASSPRYPLVEARDYTPPPASFADYRRVMEALGIDRAVLVQPSVYGTDNSAMLDVLLQNPAHLRGVVVVPPDVQDNTLADLHAAGVRGIRINRRNPNGLSLSAMHMLAGRVASMGWHIQLQVMLNDCPQLASLVETCPVPVVIDHMGFLTPGLPQNSGAFGEMCKVLEGGNLWVKLSAPYRLVPPGASYASLAPYVEAMISARADRLLWGTDWPHPELQMHMPDDLDPASLLGLDKADEKLRRLILVENPDRLYFS